MASKQPTKARDDFDPSRHKLTGLQAQRLSSISGIDAKQLTGLTVVDIGEKFRFQIDPLLLLFRKVCGRVVKTDPVTGIEYPVPYATVQVEDTDCSLLGFFPSSSKWAWYFPFLCRREVIATARTDACGNFCVWVPRWDIDWVLRWRIERVCFPIVFERPNLRELLDDLIPERIPFPIPLPDPPPVETLDPTRFVTRLSEGLGAPLARRLQALQADAGFGASTVELDSALAAPAFTRELAPPLPAELKLAMHNELRTERSAKAGTGTAQGQLAAQLRIEAADLRGLDLRRHIGPFKRCFTHFVPQWVPIIDVPDITFRVTQDIDGDGDEEQIYGEGHFQVRWNAGPLPFVKIEAGPHARAGLPCGPDNIPCGNTPAIVMAGRLPVANVPTLYDAGAGYALRTNRPHPSGSFNDPLPNPDAAAPLAGVLSLYGCNRTDAGATHYRVMYEYSNDNGASFSAAAPFVGLTWPLFRLDGGGNPEWHYPTADADGWYPIALPAGPNPFLPQDLLLDWPTGSFANGRYRLTLQLGTGGSSITSQSAPVAFSIDNSAPTGVLQVEWGFSSSGPFQPLGGVCPIVRRGASPADVYFRVTLSTAAGHLRSARLWPSGCGSGGFSFESGSGGVQSAPGSLVFEHWHANVFDNDQVLQVIYRLPGAAAAQGTYGFGAHVASRAFNPSGGDGGHLVLPAWQYDPAPIYIVPSVVFSVINANP